MAVPPHPQSARSPEFVGALVAAIAATIVLGVLVIAELALHSPPQPGQGNGQPPPPPANLMAWIVVTAAFFAIAWVATVVIHARDQVLGRLDRDRDELSANLSNTIAEYGERRETEGYLHGRRQAMRDVAEMTPGVEPRQLRPVPPPRD